MNPNPSKAPTSKLVLRSLFGGSLMGLANLVPGISGGTMLLAAGIYPNFINAISNTTRFRFRKESVVVIGCVGAAAAIAIVLLAGPLKQLVLDHRWIMYSLFIGLTLGGVPVVWRLTRGFNTTLGIAAVVAFLFMIGLAVLQAFDIVGNTPANFAMLMVAGLAGASAMILPGLSGGYLLLLLGQYVPILAGIDEFKEALKAGSIPAAITPAMTVMLPVGIGVVIGIVLVGNLLQWLLKSHQNLTLGVLLGLLLGSAAGLFPFQQGVKPVIGDVIKGRTVDQEYLTELLEEPEDWKTQFFRPAPTQIGFSLMLIAAGFAITMGVERIGGGEAKEGDPQSSENPAT